MHLAWYYMHRSEVKVFSCCIFLVVVIAVLHHFIYVGRAAKEKKMAFVSVAFHVTDDVDAMADETAPYNVLSAAAAAIWNITHVFNAINIILCIWVICMDGMVRQHVCITNIFRGHYWGVYSCYGTTKHDQWPCMSLLFFYALAESFSQFCTCSEYSIFS